MNNLLSFLPTELAELVLFGFWAVLRTGAEIVFWKLLVIAFEKVAPNKKWTFLTLNLYAWAQAISTLVSIIASYWLNKNLVFGSSNDGIGTIIAFTLVNIVSLLGSTFGMNILTESRWITNKVARIPVVKDHWPLCAKLIIVALIMVFNFVAYKFWVF